MHLRIALMLGAAALWGAPAFAAKFTSEFVEFQLPATWACELDGEWICQTTMSTKQKDAIIVLTAKVKGPNDSMDRYLTHLKKPKTHSKDGKKLQSNPLYTKTVRINDHEWVDSLHGDSEINGYYTRYLGTVKEDLGILLTYSIHKKKYQAYVKDFEAMVASLKAFRPQPPPPPAPEAPPPTDYTKSVPTTFQGGGSLFEGLGGGDKKPVDAAIAVVTDKDNSLYLIIGGVAVVLFLIWRRRQQG